jgi:hypothetical protein
VKLSLDGIYGYRLGSAVESFHAWEMLDNPPISRDEAYSMVRHQAELSGQPVPAQPPAPHATAGFLNDLTQQIWHYRPDLMDPFMLGRATARLVILAKMADYDSQDWKELWENTKESVLFGAGRIDVPRDKVVNWIEGVRSDPVGHWQDIEALIT